MFRGRVSAWHVRRVGVHPLHRKRGGREKKREGRSEKRSREKKEKREIRRREREEGKMDGGERREAEKEEGARRREPCEVEAAMLGAVLLIEAARERCASSKPRAAKHQGLKVQNSGHPEGKFKTKQFGVSQHQSMRQN